MALEHSVSSNDKFTHVVYGRTALYRAEIWKVPEVDQKYLEKVLKCGAGEGWRRSVGPIV
jgi:hypothetical protein